MREVRPDRQYRQAAHRYGDDAQAEHRIVADSPDGAVAAHLPGTPQRICDASACAAGAARHLCNPGQQAVIQAAVFLLYTQQVLEQAPAHVQQALDIAIDADIPDTGVQGAHPLPHHTLRRADARLAATQWIARSAIGQTLHGRCHGPCLPPTEQAQQGLPVTG